MISFQRNNRGHLARYVFIGAILVIIILSGISNMSAGKKIESSYTIKPNHFETVNISSQGNHLKLKILFQSPGLLNIYLIKDENINSTNPLNYTTALYEKSRVTKNLEKTFRTSFNKLQILTVNVGNENLSIIIEYEVEQVIYDIYSPWGFAIIFIIASAIIVIFGMSMMYKSRKLISEEKRELNRTLEKLIELHEIEPDSILKIIEEMSISVDQEGNKLTSALSKSTDKALKQMSEEKNRLLEK